MDTPALRELITVCYDLPELDIRHVDRIRFPIILNDGLTTILKVFEHDFRADVFRGWEQPEIHLNFDNGETFSTKDMEEYFSRYHAWENAFDERRLILDSVSFYDNHQNRHYDFLAHMSSVGQSFLCKKESEYKPKSIVDYLTPFTPVKLDSYKLILPEK